jgi:hypothetical protein
LTGYVPSFYHFHPHSSFALTEKNKEQKDDAAEANKGSHSTEASQVQKQEISQPQKTKQAEVINNPDAYDQEYPESRAEQWGNVNATTASFVESSEAVVDVHSLKRMDITSNGGQPISPSITDAWIEKVCQIKRGYSSELEGLMQGWAGDAEALFTEMDQFREQMRNDKYLFDMVYKELVDDEFIKVWKEHLEKEDRQRIDRGIEQNLKKITKKKEYKDWARQHVTEVEFNDILHIFLRRYYAIKEMGPNWEEFIKKSRGNTTNQYSDQG